MVPLVEVRVDKLEAIVQSHKSFIWHSRRALRSLFLRQVDLYIQFANLSDNFGLILAAGEISDKDKLPYVEGPDLDLVGHFDVVAQDFGKHRTELGQKLLV